MTSDVTARKDALRADVLAARSALSADERARAGASIAAAGLADLPRVGTVVVYLSVGTEPPTGELLDGWCAAGVRVLLPVIDGTVLDWAVYDGATALAPGPLGIHEPTGQRLGTSAVQAADLVLVPALAVDHAGNRLGRGRGFYDRALAAVTATVVAVVYDSELIDDVPAEVHDHRVDAVLRPAGVTSLS